jgi:hypothetical protein
LTSIKTVFHSAGDFGGGEEGMIKDTMGFLVEKPPSIVDGCESRRVKVPSGLVDGERGWKREGIFKAMLSVIGDKYVRV